jgi:1,5-anhydro-D-fructose reductase (1,5-anhydro-D-mannitol-forming)
MKVIKVGIIGYGKMGIIRHDALNKDPRSKVVSIYDPELKNIDLEIDIMESAEQVLESGIDAVFICTPNHIIKELVIKSLKRGINVFSEKPPGINIEEILEIEAMERKIKNKTLMFGFNHRFHGSIIKMKEIIKNNLLGNLLWMRGRYGKEVDENYLKDWRVDKTKSGGGILLDQGIHLLDLFLYFGGELDEVKSFVSNLYWKIPGIEDNVFAIFKNSKTGVCASLHSTMTQWRYLFSFELFFEKGSLILNGLKTSSGSYGDEQLTVIENKYPFVAGSPKKEKEITFNEDFSWELEINHFLDSIEMQTKPELGNSSDAILLMKTIDKVYKN